MASITEDEIGEFVVPDRTKIIRSRSLAELYKAREVIVSNQSRWLKLLEEEESKFFLFRDFDRISRGKQTVAEYQGEINIIFAIIMNSPLYYEFPEDEK